MLLSDIALEGVEKNSLVAVAMSGGVDSSVAAALLHEAGYKVVGITLQLYDHGAMIEKKGSCCAGQDIYDARMVADKLGFPHYVLDYESVFKQAVMDDFAESYMRGETPIPCIQCNQKVKFRDLLTTAKDLGAACLVTGHYVQRTQKKESGPELHQAKDHNRDQSYFLFTTTKEQLEYLRFPLGGMPKSEVREHADRLGLSIAQKPDSQDICFVPGGNYARVVEKLRPGALDPGEIVHTDGRVLGHHQGIIHYTIGQRRGLGVSASEPLFVVKVEPETKRVIVGSKSSLARTVITLGRSNWLTDSLPETCHVRIRSSGEKLPATITLLEDARAEVILNDPEYGISAGQACVVYDKERVLGGGWIERA